MKSRSTAKNLDQTTVLDPLTWVEVDLKALEYNWIQLKNGFYSFSFIVFLYGVIKIHLEFHYHFCIDARAVPGTIVIREISENF